MQPRDPPTKLTKLHSASHWSGFLSDEVSHRPNLFFIDIFPLPFSLLKVVLGHDLIRGSVVGCCARWIDSEYQTQSDEEVK